MRFSEDAHLASAVEAERLIAALPAKAAGELRWVHCRMIELAVRPYICTVFGGAVALVLHQSVGTYLELRPSAAWAFTLLFSGMCAGLLASFLWNAHWYATLRMVFSYRPDLLEGMQKLAKTDPVLHRPVAVFRNGSADRSR